MKTLQQLAYHPYMPMFLVLIIGIALSVSLFGQQQQQLLTERDIVFEREAEDLAVILQTAFTADDDAVRSIGLFYNASQEVTRDEFAMFVTFMIQHGNFQALEWIPHVLAAERPAYETAVPPLTFPGFHFTERDEQDGLVIAKQRDVYYPVYFAEPYVGNESAFGFDLGSNLVRLATIEKARDTGQLTMSDPIWLVQAERRQAFLLFQPIYTNGLPQATVAERRAAFEGLVLGVLPIDNIVDTARQGLSSHGMDVYLLDTAVDEQTILYSSQSTQPSSCTGMCHKIPLQIADRLLYLYIFPSATTVQSAQIEGRRPWIIGFTSVLITGLLASYLFRSNHFTVKLTELNHSLTTEVVKRQQAETSLRALVDERGYLLHFIHDIASTTTLSELINHILDGFNQVVPFAIFGLYEADWEARVLKPIEQVRSVAGNHKYANFTISIDEGIAGAVFTSHVGELVNYAQRDPRCVYPESGFPTENEHLLCLPLQAKGDWFGVILVARQGGALFTDHEFELAQLYVNQVAVVIYNARLQQQIQQQADKLKESLQEKEVLLKEIHHRVKNNLQVIASLLDLQTDYVADPQTREMLQDSRSRVRSMALVHEQLYQAHDLARIDFADYVERLTSFLFRSYGQRQLGVIDLQLEVAPMQMSVETAVPLGLIINELVSNAYKHAFVDGRSGQITIHLSARGDDPLELVIEDNGMGLPAHIDFRHSPSLGLTIVMTLIDQLQATIDCMPQGKGTRFEIGFRLTNKDES